MQLLSMDVQQVFLQQRELFNSMAIAILDYGSGNLRSALRAFERAGREVVLTSDYATAREAEGLATSYTNGGVKGLRV